mmetsp:Transcript_5401/g.13881  ORF Transcript_5401/g.13881 Transcript_5401/m.13881 type:complete len:202 (-) Transcript_5401:1070-1675(-)
MRPHGLIFISSTKSSSSSLGPTSAASSSKSAALVRAFVRSFCNCSGRLIRVSASMSRQSRIACIAVWCRTARPCVWRWRMCFSSTPTFPSSTRVLRRSSKYMAPSPVDSRCQLRTSTRRCFANACCPCIQSRARRPSRSSCRWCSSNTFPRTPTSLLTSSGPCFATGPTGMPQSKYSSLVRLARCCLSCSPATLPRSDVSS